METLRNISNALRTIENAGQTVWNTARHPLHSIWSAGSWLIHQETVFIGAAIIGAMLWTFGLNLGKKIMQWSVAAYALLWIVLSGA